MADKVTQSTDLEVKLGFKDEDTRTIKLPNPINNVTTSQIQALNTAISENNFFIGDKEGADFLAILTVDSVQTEAIKYDLS